MKREEDSSNLAASITQGEYTAEMYPDPGAGDSSAQSYGHAHMSMSGPVYQDDVQSAGYSASRNLPLIQPTLRSLQQTAAMYGDVDLSSSAQSVRSYTEQQYYSPMEYPQTSTSMSSYQSYPLPTSTTYSEQALTTSIDALNMNATSIEPYNYEYGHGLGVGPEVQITSEAKTDGQGQNAQVLFNTSLFNQSGPLLLPDLSTVRSAVKNYERDMENEPRAVSSIETRFASPFCHISPRLQSWMDYYDRNICTYLVAFDGPENPYRKHVLQLALNNEGLQNAIAALSTNNLRMRRKELRRFGFADEITDAFRGTPPREINEPSAEESCYKQMAIEHLNKQLSDRRAAQDDSVFATLLVLCLFHVCDSGFSKFKTQLTGVQKLLWLRDPKSQSDFTRWIQMFFTWFDVMTSAVNDREMQIRPGDVAMLDFSTNLGTMEQFSGCDGRLFKLIARLGRLNLLSQGRPVRSQGSQQEVERSNYLQRPSNLASRQKKPRSEAQRNHPLTAADFAHIDGNGWGTPIISSDEEENADSEDERVAPWDDRHEFWAEWHDIRTRLQSFQMDLPNIPSAASPNVPSDPAEIELGQRDMIHINELFRCSALLYTERLGYPLRPSSHYAFQRLVSEALYHITALAVDSCVNKFLLWPLFIIGTECIDEGHRDIIRRRCIEVQKESGFYNNISSLEVLERVWSEASSDVYRNEADEVRARRKDSESGRSGRYGQAFRWRKAMDRVDGEYIVV